MNVPARGQQDPQVTRAIVAAVGRVDELHARFAAITGVAPGSHGAEDVALPHGSTIYALAAMGWAAGNDHALTWLELIKARVQPERAHYTLGRSILEGAGLVHWLLSPDDPRERWRRGLNLVLKDAQQRDEYERTPGAIVDPPGPNGMDGARRRQWWLDEFKRLGVHPEQPWGHERRAEGLGLRWLYQLLSAFAHGQQWSVMRTAPREIRDLTGMDDVHMTVVTASDALVVTTAELVMAAHERALEALERYTQA